MPASTGLDFLSPREQPPRPPFESESRRARLGLLRHAVARSAAIRQQWLRSPCSHVHKLDAQRAVAQIGQTWSCCVSLPEICTSTNAPNTKALPPPPNPHRQQGPNPICASKHQASHPSAMLLVVLLASKESTCHPAPNHPKRSNKTVPRDPLSRQDTNI